MIEIFYTQEEFDKLECEDTEISFELELANLGNKGTFKITKQEYTEKGWFKTKNIKYYSLLYRIDVRTQQINFPNGTYVDKNTILTFLLGYNAKK